MYKGYTYKNVRLSVLPGPCANLILGLDFQTQHESITLTMVDPKKKLRIRLKVFRKSRMSSANFLRAFLYSLVLFFILPFNCLIAHSKGKHVKEKLFIVNCSIKRCTCYVVLATKVLSPC